MGLEFAADAFILIFERESGLHYGIGMFIWSTGSREDQAIEADEPRFIFPALEAPANGSAASV